MYLLLLLLLPLLTYGLLKKTSIGLNGIIGMRKTLTQTNEHLRQNAPNR